MTDFKDTKIFKIADFLKSNPNTEYKISDISKNLKINYKTVSSSISRLRNGRNVTKIVNGRKRIVRKQNGKPRKTGYKDFPMRNFKRVKRGTYTYFVKRDFESWKVDFKLIETNSTNKKKNVWGGKMDLSAYAIGIVPAGMTPTQVVNISGVIMFRTVLDIMQDEGVILWNAVKEKDDNSVHIGSELINKNTLDKTYNSMWEGKIYFVNNTGKIYKNNALPKIKYYISENEWD